MIIDALHNYSKPVFVYLPPNSQLRGGAWVVVDPAINSNQMEMYADPVSCRAGVLEPQGTVEIKFREKDLIQTMNRLDDSCRLLLDEMDQYSATKDQPNVHLMIRDDRWRQLNEALKTRQKFLLPFYQQVSNGHINLFLLIY